MSLAAQDARDTGIEQAVAHAERVTPTWAQQAFYALDDFLASLPAGTTFTSETVRASVIGQSVPPPPHLRAWGGAFQRAARAGLIVKAGYREAEAVHCHCAVLNIWRKA